ncbi:MAG: hypothetical protein KGH65_04010 [Candidatus Micrarchaeota archaeon]|nr:hypothetical protein [Candidatus Micrarchaeota archaeon]
MPIVFERREEDSPKSALNALAKNSMRSRFSTSEGLNRFRPIDDRFYDALSSLVMWYAIMDAKLPHVEFYVLNGYNTNIRMQTKGSKAQTLVEFATNVFRGSSDHKFKEASGEIAKYLSENVRISDGINPLFRIDPDPRDKMFKAQSLYTIGSYLCSISIEGQELLIGESLDGPAEGQGR